MSRSISSSSGTLATIVLATPFSSIASDSDVRFEFCLLSSIDLRGDTRPFLDLLVDPDALDTESRKETWLG